jgi:hypothetical protein
LPRGAYDATDGPIGDHIEDGAKLGGLIESAGSLTVDGVEQARDAVEDGAVFGMVAVRVVYEALCTGLVRRRTS